MGFFEDLPDPTTYARKKPPVATDAPLEPYQIPFEFMVHLIRTGAEARRAVHEIIGLKDIGTYLAVDEESGRVNGVTETLCVGFTPVEGHAWVFPLAHPEFRASDDDRREIFESVRALLWHPWPKAMHHGVYDDRRFVEVFGEGARNYVWDTQYSCYIVNPTLPSYSLLNLADRYLPDCKGYKRLMDAYQGPDGFPEYQRAPLKELATYNALDCHVTLALARLSKSAPAALVKMYVDAAFTIEEMRSFGPLLDTQQARDLNKKYPALQEYHAAQLRELSGDANLNPNSPKQLRKVIFDVWKLPAPRGYKNTNKETLRILEQRTRHEGIVALRAYREAKNRAERVEAFQRSAEAHDGRVTTFWWLTGTRTGRLSSGGGKRGDKRALGNLQNIPSDKDLKNTLVSDPVWRPFCQCAVREGIRRAMREYRHMRLFVSRDYSQMELRVLAQVSGEKAMLDLFNSGRDIHAALGAEWSKWDFETIQKNPDARRIVKNLHFGIIYGLGAAGLRAMLVGQGTEVTQEECEGYIRAYWKRFKKVARFRDRMVRDASKYGHVTNLLGFRIPIDVSDRRDGSWWKNQSVNAPIQGGAHQILLCGLSLLHREGHKYPNVRPQMEVHDSLVCIASIDDALDAVRETAALCERRVQEVTREEFGVNWKIPLVTDIQVGFRYGELFDLRGDDLEGALRLAVKAALRSNRALRKLIA